MRAKASVERSLRLAGEYSDGVMQIYKGVRTGMLTLCAVLRGVLCLCALCCCV